MNFINKLLSLFGINVIRTRIKPPEEFMEKYNEYLNLSRSNKRGFKVTEALRYGMGAHPVSYKDIECGYASAQLYNLQPELVLDIGSYRHFIIGLLSQYKVTTIDVRERKPITDNETVVTCDAKNLELSDESFDAVVSLCAVEHFGLARYGDAFDLDGDIKALKHMSRVLKKGGSLIFSTAVTRHEPTLAFNAHRIYTVDMIRELCSGLECVRKIL